MDRLAAVEVFTRVVEQGGFSSAAKLLGLTPSAVSKQISQLEDRLGARLLNRTTRRLSLTEVGAAFYERGQAVISALNEAEDAVTNLTAAPRGVLKVTIPVAFGQAHIAPVLPGFLTAHPEIILEVRQTDEYVDIVQDGIDVAIRVAELKDSSLIARKIAPAKRVVCASPAYLLRHGVPKRPEDLAEHNCLIFTERTARDDWVFGTGPDRRVVSVTGTVRTNSIEVLVRAAVEGLGILRVAGYVVTDHFRNGQLVSLLREVPVADSAVYAVYPAGRHLSPKVRSFIDYLTATIGQPEYWRDSHLE